MGSRKPTIVLLGRATRDPIPGIVYMTMHYVVGLERLGYDVCYVEAHGRAPSYLMESEEDDGSALAVDFIVRMLRRFRFTGRWAYHALHADGRVYGMSREELNRIYRSADLIVNLHGGTKPRPEHTETGRLVFLQTDPGHLQVELAQRAQDSVELVEPHTAFFTFAENYGNPDCGLPFTDLFEFRPTRQPVVLDLWRREGPPAGTSFRTVGSWQQWFNVTLDGEVYTWSKHHEFLKFLDLPRMTGEEFEPAFANLGEHHRRRLERHGWKVRDALSFGEDTDAYREFIHGSRGEFTVAKDQNIRLRSGWFSDRSACFLASGLPAVVQDTGFDCVLPTGEGLFAFRTVDEAAAAIEEVRADPARHGRAALEIAREYFGHEVVLGSLLSELGMAARVGGPPRRSTTSDGALPVATRVSNERVGGHG